MLEDQNNLVSKVPVIGWLQGRCLPLMLAVLGLLIIYPIFEVDGSRPGVSMRLLFSCGADYRHLHRQYDAVDNGYRVRARWAHHPDGVGAGVR